MTTLTLSKQPMRSVETKVRPITRTMLTGTAIARLPRGSRILYFVLAGTPSNAVATATVSIGTTLANANEYVNGFDVKTAATGTGPSLLPCTAGSVMQAPIGGFPGGGDQIIYVKYAETGGASTLGGWNVSIVFTTGETSK